jgi:Ricin-type beta-trefoil lectin domain
LAGSNRLIVHHYQPGDTNQQWQYNKHRDAIENRSDPNRVLDVVGGSKHNGASVCAWQYHGNDNQRWKPEFL